MKVRNGFVSNSSSSSFCIFGVQFAGNDDLADDLGLAKAPEKKNGCIHEFDRTKCKFCPECGKSAFKIQEFHIGYDEITKELRKYGLDYQHDDDCWWVGLDLEYVGELGCDKFLEKIADTNGVLRSLFNEDGHVHTGTICN